MTAPSISTTARTSEEEITTMPTIELPLPRAADAGGTTAGRRTVDQLTALLRSEWIKLTTVRTNKVILGVAVAVGLLTSWASAVLITDQALTVADLFVFPTPLTAGLAAIAGVLLFTGEVDHGTLAGCLTAHPSRWPVMAVKTCIAMGFGVVLAVTGMATGFVGALAGGVEVGDTSGMLTTAPWALLLTSGAAVLGLGVGMTVRHSAGAVSGVLVWWLIIESLVNQFAPAEVVHHLPFDSGFRTLGIDSFDSPEIIATALSNPHYALIFWTYVAAALAIGTFLLIRRDAG
jgi:ABC-2 type transport system permease protein